jgi:class 3 adenylate cyclase
MVNTRLMNLILFAVRRSPRIGINLGDILIQGDDILGDGVNIAARLEGIAEPACLLFRL